MLADIVEALPQAADQTAHDKSLDQRTENLAARGNLLDQPVVFLLGRRFLLFHKLNSSLCGAVCSISTASCMTGRGKRGRITRSQSK